MMFSASMSVVEYYLLNRFPVPYGTLPLVYFCIFLLVHDMYWIHFITFSLAAYFVAVAFVAAIIGQHVVRRLISWLGRASLIIFILAFMIFVSAISLGRFETSNCPWVNIHCLNSVNRKRMSFQSAGGVGISNMIQKFQHHEYMGFENLCKYDA
jgi:hypothetical protein